ncbi:MAG: hypothetical protein M0017_00450, partial [Desulfobacteraceae bacterium]|nr:hypothetical protein [Desulfobacteraceae bacterium]
ALWMVQRALFGPKRSEARPPDLSAREVAAAAAMVAAIVWLGLYPQPLLRTAGQGLSHLGEQVQAAQPDGKGALQAQGENP